MFGIHYAETNSNTLYPLKKNLESLKQTVNELKTVLGWNVFASGFIYFML